MSYLPTPGWSAYPWYVRLIFRLQRRKYGRELEPARLWGRTPRVFLAMSAMYGALERRSSPIEPALRSLIQVRVSQLNSCPFCTDINSASGLKRGATRERLGELAHFHDSALFTDKEKVALAYAEAMTDSYQHSDSAPIGRLRRHFSDDAIIELTALIAFQNMSSKFNAALGVPSQGFCAVGDGLTHRDESVAIVPAPVDRVFAFLDDHARLSSHMRESSWTMGGGRMEIAFDEGRGQRVGSRIRLAGRVFGIELSVDEVVTERNPPYRKVWQTTGSTRLLVIGNYRMGFELLPRAADTELRIFIEYAFPPRAPAQWLGRLFGGYYARWCTRRMAHDAARHFAAGGTSSTHALNT